MSEKLPSRDEMHSPESWVERTPKGAALALIGRAYASGRLVDVEDRLVVHDAVWSVLTDDNDANAVVCLRIAEHHDDLDDAEAGVRLVFQSEMVTALWDAYTADVVPYLAALADAHVVTKQEVPE